MSSTVNRRPASVCPKSFTRNHDMQRDTSLDEYGWRTMEQYICKNCGKSEWVRRDKMPPHGGKKTTPNRRRRRTPPKELK